jgi:phosphohistidine phosphatase
MKTLLILRHGKSSWKNNHLADHDRPLKMRGKRDADKIGTLIKSEWLRPDIILSSTAKRARDTAKIVADSSGFDGEIQKCRSIYHGDTTDYLDLLNNLGPENNIVMIVGHNPGLEEFLSDLTDESELMSTGTLAQVTLEIDDWSDLGERTTGVLINLWRPRELS